MDQKTDILLVEDNLDDAGLTIRAFHKNGISAKLVHVSNGAHALDYVFCGGIYDDRDINDVPRLILLDLKMPKIDGLEVLKKIKSDERTKNVPVVMLTSSNENNDIKLCYQLGANSYIVKPVEYDGFVKAIASLGNYWLELNQHPQK
jgi:two-component system, response regulator